MARVVVVGGGFAGMASAARLAKLRHDVTLVEGRSTLGGDLGFVEEAGYRWDAGASATTLPAVVRDLFRKSGRPLERELELVERPVVREHRFEDGTSVALPGGSRAAQQEAVEAGLVRNSTGKGPGPGEQWLAWTGRQREVWDLLRRDVLERPYSPGHAPKETASLLRSRRSLAKAADRAFRDERLRRIAVHHAVAGGHDPRNVPWWMGFVDHLEQSFGTWTVPGGLGELVAALERRLAQRGVDVVLGTTVHDLVVAGNRVAGVATSAGELPAEVVVSAVDPRRLPTLRPTVDRTMPVLPPMVCHLGLGGDVPRLPAEVVLHGDPLLTVRTTGVAPPGRAAWTVSARGRLAEDILRALARRGLDVREYVEVRVDRSPRQQVAELRGSSYGVLWQGRATVTHRLGTTTPYAGAYAAGAHSAVSAELPFVGLTAALVAEAVGPAAR